jgi:hypothetical protein
VLLIALANLAMVGWFSRMAPRPGARVVTHQHPIPGWQPAFSQKLARGDSAHTIYLYRR